jgi:hypothetical protein
VDVPTNLDKEVGSIKENSDVILRQQGECVEQMQLQVHQEEVINENRLEKFHSQIVKKDRVEIVGSNVEVK